MQNYESDNYEDFRKSVRDEYYTLKSLTELGKFPLDELESGFRGLAGCLFIPFLKVLDPFSKRIIRKEIEKKNYSSFNFQAEEILNIIEIKRAIRLAFEELPKEIIVTEDIFLKVFTATLFKEGLRSQLDIPLEPTLFAIVGYRIFSKGIQTFCDETGDEI